MITNAVRAMLQTRARSAEAFSTITYVRNRTSTKALRGRTPYEMLYYVNLDLADLHAFDAPMV